MRKNTLLIIFALLYILQVVQGQTVSEDFTSGVPSTWLNIDNNKDGNIWKKNWKGYVQLNYTSVDNDDWLILPKFKVEAGSLLSFKTKGALVDKAYYNIKVSKTGTDIADFTTTLQESVVLDDSYNFVEKSYTIDTHADINVDDEIYVAIQGIAPSASGFMGPTLYIDDLFLGKYVKSNETDITYFYHEKQVGQSVIDTENHTVTVTVPFALNLSSVNFGMSASAKATVKNVATLLPMNLLTPGEITIVAEDGTEQLWTIIFNKQAASVYCMMNQFRFPTHQTTDGVVTQPTDDEIGNVAIEVKYGTDLSKLTPTVLTSENATVSPVGEIDFTTAPVKYTITAEDATTKREYNVTVTTKVASVECDILSFSVNEQIGASVINVEAKTIDVKVRETTDLSKITPTFTLSQYATSSKVSGVEADFSAGTSTFTVTAENGTDNKDWIINISKIEPPVAVTALNEGFEAGIPDSWFVINTNNDYIKWEKMLNKANSGTKSVFAKCTYGNENGELLVLPKIKVTKNLKLKLAARAHSNWSPQKFKILVSKKGRYTHEDFSIEINETSEIKGAYKDYIIPIEANENIAINDEIYIAIQGAYYNGYSSDKIYIDDVQLVSLSSEASVLTASLSNQTKAAVINSVNRTIAFELPYGTALTALKPVFTVSTGATISPNVAQDFTTSPIEYTVTAEDATNQIWNVSVTNKVASTDKDILSFAVNGQEGATEIIVATHTINIKVSADTDLATIVPTITLSAEATVAPLSGSTIDFSAGVNSFTVTAQDKSTQVWSVNIAKKAPEVAVSTLSESFSVSIPDTWTILNLNNDSKTWAFDAYYGSDDDAGCAVLSGKYINNDYLVTPKIKVKAGYELSFFAKIKHPAYARTFKVMATKGKKSDVAGYTIVLKDATKVSSVNGSEYKFSIDENSDIADGDEIYIAFVDVSTNKGFMAVLAIDEVKVAGKVIPKSTKSSLLAFDVEGQVGETIINNDGEKSISLVFPYGKSLLSLTPTVSISEKATYSPEGEQDFSKPLTYTVTAEDGTTTSAYAVNVESVEASTLADITAVSVTGQVGNPLVDTKKGFIHIIVNPTIDVSKIALDITVSGNATVDKTGAQDFSSGDVVYVVTAQDGVSTKAWTVKVEKDATTAVVNSINESFESSESMPNGWFTMDKAQSKNWTISSSYAYSGNNCASINFTNEVENDDWIVSPKVKINHGMILSFFARSSSPSAMYKEDFEIRVSTSNKLKNSFNVLVAEVTQADHIWKQYKYVLTDNPLITDGNEVYVAIRSTSKNRGKLRLDNFVVTSDPIAELSKDVWTVKSDLNKTVTSGDGYTLTNTGIGVLTIKSITDLSESPFTTSFVKDDVALAAGESYNFGFNFTPTEAKLYNKVFVIETSVGNIVVNLAATGNAPEVAVTKIDEDFEGTLSDSWTIVDKNADKITWKVKTSASTAFESDRAIVMEHASDVSDDWLILPKYKVEDGSILSFMAKSGFLSEPDKVNIKVSKTGKNIDTDFTINILENFEIPNEWTAIELKISENENISANDEIYVAIQGVSLGKASFLRFGKLLIDNVKLSKPDALSNECAIVSFKVENSTSVDVDKDAKTVQIVMPAGTDLSNLNPLIAVSDAATFSASKANDYTKEVSVTVVAEDKTTSVWTVVVRNAILSTENSIVSLDLNEKTETVIIDEANSSILITVKSDADLSKLAPQFAISDDATVVPASASIQDFTTGDVTYTVTSQSKVDRVWSVKVQIDSFVVGLEQNFNGLTDIPQGWTVVDKDGNGKSWKIHKSASKGDGEGIKTSRNENTNNDWLITPKIKVRATDYLVFYARSASSLTPEDFNVKVAKIGKNIDSDFNIVLEEVVKANSNYGFKQYIYKLTDNENISEDDMIYVAIQVVSTNAMELHIDNFSVTSTPEIKLYGSEFTSVTKIGDTFSSEKSYTITNTEIGELTITSATDLSATPFTTSFKADEVKIKPGETYSFSFTYTPTADGETKKEFIIKSNGGDVKIDLYGYAYGDNVYHQGFEGEHDLRGWIVDDIDRDGLNWTKFENSALAPDLAHTGSMTMYSESAKLKGGAAVPDNYLITPKLTVKDTDKLVYWIGAVSDISFKERYSVLVSTTTPEIAAFTDILIDKQETAYGWTKVEIDLSKYKDKNIFIAFRHHDVTDESQLIIDDIIMPAKYVAKYPDMGVMVKRLEYSMMPHSQMEANFIVIAGNLGATLTEEKTINVKITGTDYSQSVKLKTPFKMWDVQKDTIKVPFKPTKAGEYEVVVSIDMDNDENQEDNSISYKFNVSDNIIARDNGNVTNVFGTTKTNTGIVGQTFDIINDTELESVSFYLYKPSVGDKVSVTVRKFADKPADEIATSEEIVIATSKNQWYTLDLKERLKLTPGKYFIGINEKENERLHLAIDQTVYTPKSVYMNFDDEWYSMEEWDASYRFAFMIRANLYVPKSPEISVSLNSIEYPIVPLSEAQIKLSASLYNDGAALADAANVTISVDYSDFSEDVAIVTPFDYKTSQVVESKEFFKADRARVYNINASIDLDSDLKKENNNSVATLEVTETEMARETGEHNHKVGLAAAGTIGQRFSIINDQKLNSVKFFLENPTVGETLSVTVRKFDKTPGDEIAKSETITIDSDESKWYTVALIETIDISKGEFFIGLNQLSANSIKLAVDTTIHKDATVFTSNSDIWTAIEASNQKYTCLLRAIFDVPVITAITDRRLSEAVSVYPNPTSEFVNIDLDFDNDVDVYFYDVNGKCVKQIMNTTNTQFNIHELPKGTYFIKLFSNNKLFHSKVIIL